jgi:hypothetical protein
VLACEDKDSQDEYHVEGHEQDVLGHLDWHDEVRFRGWWRAE